MWWSSSLPHHPHCSFCFFPFFFSSSLSLLPSSYLLFFFPSFSSSSLSFSSSFSSSTFLFSCVLVSPRAHVTCDDPLFLREDGPTVFILGSFLVSAALADSLLWWLLSLTHWSIQAYESISPPIASKQGEDGEGSCWLHSRL